MPVRSLNSSILRWPDKAVVISAFRAWAEAEAAARPEVERIGYFGSYARGNWGVGSDLDVVVVVDSSDEPFMRRALAWRPESLPVLVDLLVYTTAELPRIGMLRENVVWVV